MIKSKFKASLIHLLLSAIIISALISVIILFWYPSPFLGVTDFKDIATIIISIDLILGPILTFIVFNPTKKGLKFDLTVIATLQIMGLSYGLYTLYLTHPVYITYHENSFNIITAKNAKPELATDPSLKVSKLSSPTFTYLNIPNERTKNELFSEMMNGGNEIETRSEYYEPYTSHLDKIIDNSIDSTELFSDENIDIPSKIFLQNNDINEYAYVPLINGSTGNGIIVLDRDSGKPISLIKTNPWRFVKN